MIAPADLRELGPRLAGLRVLVTRPEEDAAAWAEGIASLGGVPVVRPALVCETLRGNETERRLRAGLVACDRLILTSARAVDALEEILGSPLAIDVPVAAVGARTADRARRAGLRVVLEAPGGSVASLADSLRDSLPEGRLLHVGAEETRPGLEPLEESGRTRVERVAVYRTTPIAPLPPGERQDLDVDVVLLASPSAVNGLVGHVRLPTRAQIVTLGPSTTAAAEGAGLSVAGEAATRDLLGMLRAIPNGERAIANGERAIPNGESATRAPSERSPLVASPTRPGRERPRRLRRTATLRALVRETRPFRDALVMPHFVLPKERGVEAVTSMPGIARLGLEDLRERVKKDLALGIRAVLLFGICPKPAKDERGSEAWNAEAVVPRAVRDLKKSFGDDLVVITDVCLCAYTSHGHCGWLHEGQVDNDASLAAITSSAVCHAEAGADLVAPSDMMDGRVRAIRDAFDARGLESVGILSYAVKYASAYYGPFRDAADSAPGHGDRKSYQMDPANVREAVREARLDEAEGADLLMVKPALAYLDVLRAVRDATQLPLAAYNVSGEYSQVKAAAERGWIDEGRIVHENLTAMVRAGADILITYHAREALERGWLA